jgi:hypothetical protein
LKFSGFPGGNQLWKTYKAYKWKNKYSEIQWDMRKAKQEMKSANPEYYEQIKQMKEQMKQQ